MNSQNKKLALFFCGLAVFTLILVFGADFLLRKMPIDVGRNKDAAKPRDAQELPANAPGQINIIEPSRDIQDNRPVTYTNSGFGPEEVTITADDPFGCTISVTNRSSKVIHIGLNPHSAAKDPGVDYGDLAANERGIYDVRYPGKSEAELHNHYKPEHSFRVIYGKGCK